MAFLGETILLGPRSIYPLPTDTFAFFKKVTVPKNDKRVLEPGFKVKIYFNQGPMPAMHPHPDFVRKFSEPFILEIASGRVDSTDVSVYMRHERYFNSVHDIIVEVDEVPGEIINPNLDNIDQDELVAQIKAHPELGEKIPHVLFDSHTFLQKMTRAKLGRFIPEYIRTRSNLRRVSYYGNKTGTVNASRLPKDVSKIMHDFAGIHQPEDTLEADIVTDIRAKERELKAERELPSLKAANELKEDNERANSYFSSFLNKFRRMGGTRRKRQKRTRRFKK